MTDQTPITPPREPVIGDNSKAQEEAILAMIAENGIDTILSVYIGSHSTKIDKLVVRGAELKASVDRAVIDSQDKADNGATVLKMITTLESVADADKKDIKGPILTASKALDAVFKSIADGADSTKKALKKKLGAFEDEKEQKAAAERARLQAEAEQAQRAAEAAAAAGSATQAEIASQKAETLAEQAQTHAAVKTRSAAGASVHTRKDRRWEITDHALLAPDFWKPDEDKISAAVKGLTDDEITAGGKLAGIRTYFETAIVGR
ncbi:hypothetical protein [Ferrovibrio sp.]|uniref:hypothetical protein n=1 Tax=Ferrovibrio sp. TaxID=1917215 RepID=UPI00312008A7